MKTSIVLVMHGVPPKDFPRREIGELMSLRGRLEHGAVPPQERTAAETRLRELDRRVRDWPRSAGNDTFYMASQELAEALKKETGCEVILGFNEFCAPAVPDALDTAAANAGQVIVVTPMLTPGGEHAEVEIPGEVDEARRHHPQVSFAYAWPYAMEDVARFLARRMEEYINRG